MDDTTPTLVSKAQAGDRGAFDALVGRYEKTLREIVRLRMGPQVQGKLEPEDVLQETFLRAFESIARFRWRDEAGFLRWLQSIAENRIRDAVKGPRGNDVLQLFEDAPGGSTSPSRQARRQERFDRLEASLARLSPDHRRVILLSRIEGLKVKEVALRMHRSESAVKNLLLRALHELKSSFGDTESLHLPGRRLGSGESDGNRR
jgi:RNA polymerase sigma-70 factor (ECF subfamily)